MHDHSMTLVTGVARGERPGILHHVAARGQAAAIWQRQRDARFADWIDGLAPEILPQARCYCTAPRAREVAQAACEAVGLLAGPERDMLCGDIGALSALFAQVMGRSALHLRLDVVRDDACRKFHLDHVPARLLCSYRGTGTEYGLMRGQGDPQPVCRMATGEAGIFRGALWPGDEMSGVVHRSPPIAGQGEIRLLLVLDVLEAGHHGA